MRDQSLCIQMYGDRLRYLPLVALIIILHLLMMQLAKYGFIYLEKKSNVFQTFKNQKCLVENETGKKLKCLRSDNGGEYCSHEFENYCSTNGICRQKTIPRTPQENGVSQYMNMTVIECA